MPNFVGQLCGNKIGRFLLHSRPLQLQLQLALTPPKFRLWGPPERASREQVGDTRHQLVLLYEDFTVNNSRATVNTVATVITFKFFYLLIALQSESTRSLYFLLCFYHRSVLLRNENNAPFTTLI